MKDTTRKYLYGIVLFAFLFGGYFLLDSYLYTGVRPRALQTNGFQAKFYATDTIKNKPVLVIVGGGAWGDYWAQLAAKNGYAGLSLPYTGKEGLPLLPEEIPLEYFEKAIGWLQQQPEVDPERVVVMGASRNAELALLLASTLNQQVKGVIAFAPSSVVWSNTVLPYNSNEVKPSWTYQTQPIAYIPMEKLRATDSSIVETLSYWKRGLSDTAQVALAAIPVERINGPILLFSGEDDQVWASVEMSTLLEKRLRDHRFRYTLQNIVYKQAGHLVSGQPGQVPASQSGQMMIQGKTYAFAYGGTAEGDKAAQADAHKKVWEFMSKL